MRLLRYEWSKLSHLPAFWGVLVLCLAFNCLLIGSGDRWRWEWNETASMTGGLGQRVDTDFLDRLGWRPQSDYRDYLLSAAEGMTDVYADYDLKSLSNFYNDYVKSSPTAAALMERKYERLAERIAHLSETGAAMDWYGGAGAPHDTTPRRGFQSEGQRVAGKGGVQTQRAKTKRLKLRLIAGKVAHRFVIRRGEGETQGRQGKHIQQGRFRLGENKQAEGAAEAERRAGGALLLAVKADAENMVAAGHAACPGRVRGSGRTHSAPAERSGAGAFKMCGHDQ